MGRAQGVCRLCPDQRRQGRNRVHRDDQVQQCADCGDGVCARHVRWLGDRWACTKCARRPATGDPPTATVMINPARPTFEICGAPGCPRIAVAHGFCLRDQRLWRPTGG